MDRPAAQFAEDQPVRALDKAYDDYITEVGADAVAAQFGVPVDFVNERKLKPEIAFFLFDRQADLHRTALEIARGSAGKGVVEPEPGLPGLPRMIPMTQRHGNWIDPLPPRRRDEGTHNAPVM